MTQRSRARFRVARLYEKVVLDKVFELVLEFLDSGVGPFSGLSARGGSENTAAVCHLAASTFASCRTVIDLTPDLSGSTWFTRSIESATLLQVSSDRGGIRHGHILRIDYPRRIW